MSKGSITRQLRYYHYQRLREAGCSREQAIEAMDFSEERYWSTLKKLRDGLPYDKAKRMRATSAEKPKE